MHTVRPDGDRNKHTAPPKARPFPLAPLEALFPPVVISHGDGFREWPSISQIADAARIPAKTLYRARHYGGLTAAQADLIAIRIGLHPLLVWGSLWEQAG